jgi:hypothetical protein
MGSNQSISSDECFLLNIMNVLSVHRTKKKEQIRHEYILFFFGITNATVIRPNIYCEQCVAIGFNEYFGLFVSS